MVRLTVNLVSHDNGVGLTVDAEIMRALLAAHDVAFVEWNAATMRRCDVAVFLELWNARLARLARATIGIFNLEWFSNHWRRDLGNITQLWAKSHEAFHVYKRLGLTNARYTGFASRDFHDPSVPRELRCIHVRGKSGLKGTERVLEAWRAAPDLPPLTIVSADPLNAPPNVRVTGRIPQSELVREMNAHAIHVCPSASEGWAHYITEGLSTGAVVITTDASPMREHICDGGGVLLPVTARRARGLVTLNDVSAESIAAAVRQAARMAPCERSSMGERARRFWTARNRAFEVLAQDALAVVV